jgi:hypothetical protein
MKRVFNLVLFSLLGLYIFSAPAKAQEDNRFRRDCNYVSEYNEDTEEWGEWKSGSNTFVFNINQNNDIRWHYASGRVEVLRHMDKRPNGKTNNGVTYQTITVMDEEGRMGEITLYENGIVLIFFKGFMLRFSP